MTPCSDVLGTAAGSVDPHLHALHDLGLERVRNQDDRDAEPLRLIEEGDQLTIGRPTSTRRASDEARPSSWSAARPVRSRTRHYVPYAAAETPRIGQGAEGPIPITSRSAGYGRDGIGHFARV